MNRDNIIDKALAFIGIVLYMGVSAALGFVFMFAVLTQR